MPARAAAATSFPGSLFWRQRRDPGNEVAAAEFACHVLGVGSGVVLPMEVTLLYPNCLFKSQLWYVPIHHFH